MISAKKLVKLARKWQKLAAIKRKRITSSSASSSMVEKGHFVVYSADEKRFMLPLEYLKNQIVLEYLLFHLAEEEFGIPSDGHLKLPRDSTFKEYAISLTEREASNEVEKALIVSIVNGRWSSSSNLYQQETSKQDDQCQETYQIGKEMAAIKRKRITFSRTIEDVVDTNNCSTSSVVKKGHFVVYSTDEMRFVLPLEYLKNEIVMELFDMADEFGLSGNGFLILPCDATFMEYVIALIKRKPSKAAEQALILSVACDHCTSSYLYQQETSQQLQICGF